jgi:flagellar hook-associated protein 3 FlgL
MRISTNYVQQQNVSTILQKQRELLETQNQVSTGQRFNSPHEDPIAAVKSLDVQRQLNLNDQYLDNADTAETKLEITDGILSGAGDILQRIRELAVQSLNDTNDAVARQGIAEEIEQLNMSLLGLANTRDNNGESIFAGYQSDQDTFDSTTYAYNGDSGQRSIRVGDGFLVEINEPGDQIFVTNYSGGGTQAIFQTIENFVTALNANTVNAPPNDIEVLQNIDAAMTEVFAARTRVGSRLNAIDEQRNINEDIKFNNQVLLAEVKDLDYAEAISRLDIQLTGLEAAQQSFVRVQNLSLFNFL